VVVRELQARSRKRLQSLPEPQAVALLEDLLYQERKRLERAKPEPELEHHLDELAKALVRGSHEERLASGMGVIGLWADEIHGRFNPRVYRLATRALPRALTGLLSGRPDRMRDWSLSSQQRLKVKGDLPLLKQLARESTLVLAPTHVSNLDSPLIGLALYLAGLPPFVYGAGLNLFSNPVVGWWLGRLGAYTVDRTKRARLYKDVLKDYSVRCLTTRHHSLFFPGGTRSRSHEVEPHIKKGLLGTAAVAWQEMLEAGRPDSEVYVVPLTLSFTLTLEAATLIEDHLADAGKQRYIITDDEFAQPRRLAAFARRVLDLDSAMVAHFGDPVDVLGFPVSADPEERRQQAEHRRRYVTDARGRVEFDPQRDRIYTDRLGESLIDAWPRYAEVLPTHLAAWAAWRCLEEQARTTDPFRLVRLAAEPRRIDRSTYEAQLRRSLDRVRRGAAEGRWQEALPAEPSTILDQALDRFARYHRSRALCLDGGQVFVQDPKLCLYYRNRLTFMDRGAK
jgi:glycerol-3-phosphate O-acyltransferase